MSSVAEYLNDMAELDPDKGIKLWLVEARAVRIGDSPWAPLFDTIVRPNNFTASVGAVKRSAVLAAADEYWSRFTDSSLRRVVEQIISRWQSLGHGVWYYRDGHATLNCPRTGNGRVRPTLGGRTVPGRMHRHPIQLLRRQQQWLCCSGADDRLVPQPGECALRFRWHGQRAKTGPTWISEPGPTT